jgi:hypothetical protein
MLMSLTNTNHEDGSKWSDGLHYGKKRTMYINMALDAEDKDIVHISISSTVKFQPLWNGKTMTDYAINF